MKKLLLLTYSLCFVTMLLQAQDLTISGGNGVSTMICANGSVFTWGDNSWTVNNSTTYYGALGTGNTTSAIISTPEQVNLPAEAKPIKQVDAGSGGHFIAMGCNGTVWCWGNNTNHQIGNSTFTDQCATVPYQVMSGEVNPSSPTSFLTGVKYISGGNDENYAILETGELVAWGQNNVGQLGNGTTGNDVPLPVYVCKADGSHLTNVIMVEAGDETGYALVDDDGDGVGTVYSWGGDESGKLGRVATAAEPKYYAAPVRRNAGTPVSPVEGDIMDNIVSLTAGDCMGVVIDEDGYVWSWGHGAWGGMTGTWSYGSDHTYASQVLGGETGEPYLKAKAVSAGQGYGMAVTLDGLAVAWGNNGATNRSGGNLGNGTAEGSSTPVYIRIDAATPVENCLSISDGDTWGFITTSDNTIFTWGDNCVGQLGIGNTTHKDYAVKMGTLANCSVPDPKPVVTLPSDFYTCVPFSYTINPGFTNTNNNYSYEWYKDGVLLTKYGTKNETITVTEIGTYKLVLSYVGENSPCGMDPAEGEFTISAYTPDFTIPTDLTFCPTDFTVHVNGDGVYDYYTAKTGGNYLGTSYKSEETTFSSGAVVNKQVLLLLAINYIQENLLLQRMLQRILW